MHRSLRAFCSLLILVSSPAMSSTRYVVERAVMVIRHGVRAPLDGEASAGALARQAFPVWSTQAGWLTPHGAAALRLLGAYDRIRFEREGLLPRAGCPATGTVSIWANTTERTIASGHALADGLAPGCGLAVDHRPDGQMDPLFDAVESGQVPIDARAAAISINRELDGGRALTRGQKPALAAMAHILGCDTAPHPCRLDRIASRIEPGTDGRGISLSGAINLTSGIAQVFMLQYAEGMPMAQVGWGRATPARIEQVSRLHALLFAVYARSRAMAPLVGGLLARRIADDLTRPSGPRISLLVGHDNTIAAVTALLGSHFRIPGYGQDDPPIGGGLLFERLRDRTSGHHFVRLFYEAQSPARVRHLVRLDDRTPPAMLPLRVGLCGDGYLCPLGTLARLPVPRAGAAMSDGASR